MGKVALTNDTPFAKNYARSVPVFSHGRGVWLRDADGNRFLDFGSGIAVNAFGYGDRKLARRVASQMRRLVHVSNLYATAPGLELGRQLLELVSPGGRQPFTAVHFGNSGAEANEAAIKYARLYARSRRGEGHYRVLSFHNAFHGRTLGALSATPKPKYREAFEPLVPGFDSIPYNDPEVLRVTLDDSFAAVFVEVVQGEGGLSTLSPEMVTVLNELTRENDILLVADEIQTGLGRVGDITASAGVGLTPDIVTLSKPLAGGLPLSATLIPARVNDMLSPGDHGTTFGGGPVTSTAGLYTLERLTREGFLEQVRGRSEQLDGALKRLQDRFDWIVGLPGRGLLRGLEIDFGDGGNALFDEILPAARERGLLVLRSGTNVVRIAPPLIISSRELQRGIRMLSKTLSDINSRRKR